MDLGNSNLNPSSIIDLKAELHKKYESFRKAKLTQNVDTSHHKPLKRKGDQDKEKKIKHLPVVKPVEENREEEFALKKSRLALEAKAKLYEKIISSNVLIDDEQNENYLVDFQRKVLYGSTEIEKVQPQENITNSSTSSNIMPDHETTDHSATVNKNVPPPDEITQFYTKDKAKISNNDQTTHYQNVQHNEARDHGTGYFAFSTDEAKRKEQMEELNLLRQQTEDQRLVKQKLLQKRKTMLQNRLAKICERKNIDQSVLETFTKTDTENTGVPQNQGIDLSSIPLPETKPETSKKEPKIRPWDIGKDNLQHFVPQKSQIKSQNEWVKERREERKSEFAPPSFYSYSNT